MKRIQAFGIGTIICPGRMGETPNQRRYVETVVQLEPITLPTGKSYQQRVNVRAFGDEDIAKLALLTKGSVIGFSGNVDGVPHTNKAGKTHANLQVTGQITSVVYNNEVVE